jgi:hypothetical protein
MQFKATGRLSVIRRMEGVGKVIFESWTAGGGVVKFVEEDIAFEGLRVFERDAVWKTRTGQGVRESL